MRYDFLDKSLNDKEFAKRFAKACDEMVHRYSKEDFEIDPVQLDKLTDLVAFFSKAANDLGGKIDSIDIDPMTPPSGVTASFIVFDLAGDDIQEFCDVIRECSAISMDVTEDDKISISCTIPRIFTLRE